MAGILYLTRVPKFNVVAPTNSAKTIAKKKQYNTTGFLRMVEINFFIPTFFKTNNVNNIIARLSSEESKVDIFLDSHKNGLKKVATIAAGAILIRLPVLPSNSTPNEK